MLLEDITRSAELSDALAALSDRVRASVVLVVGQRSGSGSGVVWNDEGLVITNDHVVPGERAEIDLGRDGRIPARVTARSRRHDLAALQVDRPFPARRVSPAAMGDSSKLRAGEIVVAVGNPLGERNATTMGLVSAPGSSTDSPREPRPIQVAITLRPGNSGGALADVHGQVVGIPNMVVGAGRALAVPSQLVEILLSQDEGGRPILGIRGEWIELPERVVRAYELFGRQGLLVLEVESGSPAEQGGLMMGDTIVSAHTAHSELSPTDLVAQLARAPMGEPLRVTLLRGGALRWVDVTLRAR